MGTRLKLRSCEKLFVVTPITRPQPALVPSSRSARVSPTLATLRAFWIPRCVIRCRIMSGCGWAARNSRRSVTSAPTTAGGSPAEASEQHIRDRRGEARVQGDLDAPAPQGRKRGGCPWNLTNRRIASVQRGRIRAREVLVDGVDDSAGRWRHAIFGRAETVRGASRIASGLGRLHYRVHHCRFGPRFPRRPGTRGSMLTASPSCTVAPARSKTTSSIMTCSPCGSCSRQLPCRASSGRVRGWGRPGRVAFAASSQRRRATGVHRNHGSCSGSAHLVRVHRSGLETQAPCDASDKPGVVVRLDSGQVCRLAADAVWRNRP